MKYLFLVCILMVSFWIGCASSESPTEYTPSKGAVNSVLDDWHNAAAEADFDRYFNHFTGDSAIFMGTDATERWTIAEFKPWSKSYFDRGDAWNFIPVKRHVYFSDTGETAWFDEALDTPNLGPSRGTGVLVRQDSTWKIAHYNLSIPIPNAIVEDVVDQIESENAKE
ncbi:MAG: nuclear transport factor 2 family protein [Balneolaceae bacterium]|nr:nuclear transport factor 2 family protein [Balneolaceae bacterium]